MSRFRRRLLMMAAASKSQLPAGWKEIEYISFPQAAEPYIDTQIIPTATTKVEIVWSGMHNDFTQNYFFGNDRYLIAFSAGQYRFQYGTNSVVSTETYQSAGNGTFYTKYVKDGRHNHVTAMRPTGDVEYDIPDNTGDFSSDSKTLYLGHKYNCPGWAAGANRIKYCKIWENSEPVRDFIPVSDGTQEALYDQVTKTLFYKQSGPKTLDMGNEAEGGVE